MTSHPDSKPDWGRQYRAIASEKWKAKSAVMGQPVTDALVEYAQPQPGIRMLDLASGTGGPAVSLASRGRAEGHVTALDLSADLLEITAQRTRARGFKNFTTRRAGAHTPAFFQEQVRSRTPPLCVMFFCDPVLGWQELRRAFLAWGHFAVSVVLASGRK
jgi:SAM-dependent methyltransferase